MLLQVYMYVIYRALLEVWVAGIKGTYVHSLNLKTFHFSYLGESHVAVSTRFFFVFHHFKAMSRVGRMLP